jgi:lysophospholipase L1-like esterase
MFTEDENGVVADKKLAYPIAKLLEVRSADLKTLYEDGKDYEVTQDGSLRALDGTSMAVTGFNSMYHDTDVAGVGIKSKKYPDKFIDYGEGVHFYYRQVCVTYIRTAEYNGPEINNEEILTETIQKLKNKEALNIVFYGDSITTGCNASSQSRSEPNMPFFDKMVVSSLTQYFGNDKITYANTAVGGWATEQGLAEYNTRVLAKNPDLLILGFGMNDATLGTTEEQYGNRIVMMINNLRKRNPNAEILLLGTMNANPDATSQYGDYQKNQRALTQTLKDIATGYEGVAVADITSMHDWLLERKDYCDMTGNNVNHPSDFLVRIYAQMILSIFLV